MAAALLSFAPPALRSFTAAVIKAVGSDEDEAHAVADHLVEANLRGHDSHGVGMLPHYVQSARTGALLPNAGIGVLRDTGPIIQLDGNRGYGQRIGAQAMEMAIRRCAELGVVLVTLRNVHHLARIGAYGEMAASAGLGSVHFVNVTDHEPLVAAFGGAEARFGTNPVCVALPATPANPAFVLDFATSMVAYGKVREAFDAGVEFDEEVLLDHAGRPSRRPADMMAEPRGAQRPFGLHKGYGLMMAAELLAGVMSAGVTLAPHNDRHGGIVNHMFSLLFDPGALVDEADRIRETDALIDYVRSSRPADPGRPVMIAGEPERLAKEQRLAGGIPLSAASWQRIVDCADSVGVDAAEFAGLHREASGCPPVPG